ncbi:unnamed protein product [Schistosoma spindalis]|nr:unnamed protein product [Schistosoma spindale]
MCKFCDQCKNIDQYKWYLIGLIPSSTIFSLLMVTVRDMRARFPINYIFLFLNVSLHIMGTFFIVSVLPVLLFIGQQLIIEYSPRMLPSYYILYAVLVSVIYLFIFYSISVQFLSHRNKSTLYSC